MLQKTLIAGLSVFALACSVAVASAETIRIAEHRAARIEALQKIIPQIEKDLGVTIEVVEYPAPEEDYLTKLLTELKAGNAPDVFTAPLDQDVDDMVAAGYLAPLTDSVKAWPGYGQLFDVAKALITQPDGNIYVVPNSLNVEQLYYRRDILEKAGISTEQPKTWADLLDRAREIKAKTGEKALLFPAGVTWGGGTFDEGFQHLLVGSSTPQIANPDGTFNLTGQGVADVLGFYKTLIDEDLTPIDPLLGPEPWVVPKYKMFPAGQLVATTCGSWCYIYDWGPEGDNPIPDVEKVVGTWAVPGKDGGEHVVVGLDAPWAVNANAGDVAMATKVVLELGSIEASVAYAQKMGGIPPRKDVAGDPDFQKMSALAAIHAHADEGTYLRKAPGFSAVAEGVGRATEALLRKTTDVAGAQKILVDYERQVLGDDKVK